MVWLPDGNGDFNITSCWQAARNASSQVQIGEIINRQIEESVE